MFYLVLFIDRYRYFKSLYYVCVYLYLYMHIQCNFIYILNIRVFIDCISCFYHFDPMSA